MKKTCCAVTILASLVISCLFPHMARAATSGTFSITVTVSASFGSQIVTPASSTACSQTPVITGTTTIPAKQVTIKGKSGGSVVTVATTTSDAGGNYAVEVDLATPLDTGTNTLTPYVDGTPGIAATPVVEANPSPSEQPSISSPADEIRMTDKRPVISGSGLPGQTVILYCKDPNGVISQRGQATVNSGGSFSITPTSDFSGGKYFLFVVIGGVASPFIEVTFVDPYGRVYDSKTDQPIAGAVVTIQRTLDAGASWFNAVPGTDIASTDINPQTTAADGAYSFLTANGNFRFLVSKNGYSFPSTIIASPLPAAGSHGELFTVSGAILNIDLPMDFTGSGLLKITKDANKKDVVIGDIVTYTVAIKNEGSGDVTSVYLQDKLAPGLKYLEGKVLLNGNPIADPSGSRTKTFNIGTVPAAGTTTLRYQVIVGSGVSFGKYENSAWCEFSSGQSISNTATETVQVVEDPLFDLGTVIGKVFMDRDGNGIQADRGQKQEEGIAYARIVMEDGTVVVTDQDGKYHLPGVMPGRHALRLDESSLAAGSTLTTPKVVVLDVRPGLMSKVNFGINSAAGAQGPGKSPVNISKGEGLPKPRLNVALDQDVLSLSQDNLYRPATFRIFTNYALFIDTFTLEIFESQTRSRFKSFEGKSGSLSAPITWDGAGDQGARLKENKKYFYVLTVRDKRGKTDTTKEKEFRVSRAGRGPGRNAPDEDALNRFWEAESSVNNLARQTIKIEGETVVIKGLALGSQVKTFAKPAHADSRVTVKVAGPATPADGRPVEICEWPFDGELKREIIIPKGEHTILVETEDRSGQKSEYSRDIKIGDDYCLFVALADTKAGYNMVKGSVEPVDGNEEYKKGLWVDGRLAYYLKAKIKGKYLVTSSLDTKRDQKELFRYIDPDKYYPVYGDNSQLYYDAANTQGLFYALVEWDRSQIVYGNYNITLNDTEFARFTRTLYGGKAELISASDSKFGNPNTKIITYTAKAKQKAAHNEFLGTGTSLYYLKHKYIVEGSDKVRIESRDKVTGLVLASLEQKEGSDYQIDYGQGRIIFWKPVFQIAQSDSVIQTRLLDGDNLYVVVDYEYYTKDKIDELSKGGRISQQLGDYLRVGGTYVEDNNETGKNYELMGTDATLQLNADTKLDLEYAESNSAEGNSFVSTDGGFSFSDLSAQDGSEGKAYGLKGRTRLFGRADLSGYYQKIEKGFSSSFNLANQGTQKAGAEIVLGILPNTVLSLKHDTQKLLDDTNLAATAQIGATETRSTTVRIDSQITQRLKSVVEYRKQEVSGKKEPYLSESNEEGDIVAGKLAYRLTKKTTVSIAHQEPLSGEDNRQTTVGTETAINQHLSVRVSQSLGDKGSATTLGATANLNDRLELFGDYSLGGRIHEGPGSVSSAGLNAKLDDKTSLYNIYSVSDAEFGKTVETFAFGSKRKLSNGYEVSAGREFSKEGERAITNNTYGLSRELGNRRVEGSFKDQTAFEADGSKYAANIFALVGDINDKIAALFGFEKGTVQNLDGSQTDRLAVSAGLSYVNKDRFKASSKLEYRHDGSVQNSRQIFSYNALEIKLTPDTTVFGKANVSFTKNTSTASTLGQYKELVIGLAYRPVYFDRLNLIGKYTFLQDKNPSSQQDFQDIEQSKANVFGLEAIYELTAKWQLVGKGALRFNEEKVSGFGFTQSQTWLMAQRLNYKINGDWQIGAEYRWLIQSQAKDNKQGVLLEVARQIGDFMQLGLGYNFTEFNDDLTHLDYRSQGPFIRVTGTFFDRTAAEIERAKKKRR